MYCSAIRKEVKLLNSGKQHINALEVSSGEYIINEWLGADRSIITLPLKEAPLVYNPSEQSFKASEGLDYNSVIVVGLSLRRPIPRQH